jgi:DNA repair exonuclease SbcCD nuclease subunit
MAVVFTADLQLRNHQNRSHTLPSGRNSRLQNGLDCIKQAASLTKGGTLVLNGDIYDDRHHLGVDVVDAVCETILDVSKECFVIINVGNHDQFLKDGSIHSLRMFAGRKRIKVVPETGAIYADVENTCRMAIHPYTENLSALQNFIAETADAGDDTMFLVLHQAVKNALLSNGEIDKTGIAVKQLRSKSFEAVILGHYHRPQQIGENKIFYVGSPYQINSGEGGEEKRFIVYEDDQLKFVPVEGMPRFVTVKSLDEVKNYPNDFVTLVCSPEELVDKKCPENVAFIPLRDQKKVESSNMVLGNFDLSEAVREDLRRRGAEHLVTEALRRLNQ